MSLYIASSVGKDDTHPPIANKVICVDYDATLVPWGGLDETPVPLDYAREAMNIFKRMWYKIVILTSRMSPTWWKAEGWGNSHQVSTYWWNSVADVLERHDIPFDMITAEKVPAEYYIDDKALEFKNNWEDIVTRVIEDNKNRK
jgi:hypothetical protein